MKIQMILDTFLCSLKTLREHLDNLMDRLLNILFQMDVGMLMKNGWQINVKELSMFQKLLVLKFDLVVLKEYLLQ